MSERLTNTEIDQQLVNFNKFLNSVDLVKLGRRYYHVTANDAKDGMYTPYVYLLRVLRRCANVEGTCSHPDTCKAGVRTESYHSILHDAAISAMTDWFNAFWEAVKEINEDMQQCVNTDMVIYKGGKGYTPTQILWHIRNLSTFGRQYVADYADGKKLLAQGK